MLPTWELELPGLPEEARHIATERLKWSLSYQKKHGITSGVAKDLPEPVVRSIGGLCKRVYRSLMLSGYARIDLRLAEDGRVVVLEANPNPQLAYGEDFAEAAEGGRPALRAAPRADHDARPRLGARVPGVAVILRRSDRAGRRRIRRTAWPSRTFERSRIPRDRSDGCPSG